MTDHELFDGLTQLGIGTVVIILVGRSIYRLIGEWAFLAKRAQQREDDADHELHDVRVALAASQAEAAQCRAEAAEMRLELQLEINALRSRITELEGQCAACPFRSSDEPDG